MRTLYDVLPTCLGDPDEPVGIAFPTWLRDLVPDGLPRGMVTIAFGDTGNFKTTFKTNVVMQALYDDNTVLDWSLEDGQEILGQYYLSYVTGIPQRRINNGKLSDDERFRIREISQAAEMAKKHYLPDPEVKPTIENIRNSTKGVPDIDLLVVDYAQLVEAGFTGDNSERFGLIALMKMLQQVAKEQKIAVLLMSQIKDIDNRKNKRPQLRDLFGSRNLSFGTKLAIAIYRPWVHEREGESEYDIDDPRFENILELWIRKNKRGPIEVCKRVHVDLPTGIISDIDDIDDVNTDQDEVPF